MPTQTSVSTSLTDVPSVLRPYLTEKGGILPEAQKLIGKDYAATYGDALANANLAGSQRVASVSPMQQKIGEELNTMRTPGEFDQGSGAVGYGIGALQGMNDAAATQQYMSPYIQNVLNVNKQEAERDFRKNQLAQNLKSMGSYGSSGNILAQSEANRNLQANLAKIQATGMQQAFEDARKSQIAQAQGLTQAGTAMGQLGTARQASDIDRLKTQGAYGDLQRNIQQQQLDTRYNDLMARLNFPMTQLETMNNLVRGVPLTQTGQTMTQTTPPPSFASQLAGMGLTGLSLYNMFGK
jgi:hypothetical protein